MKHFALILLLLCVASPAIPNEAPPPEGHFIQVNNITLYYESQGQGDPILIMHGGLLSHTSMDAYAQNLSSNYRVIAPDSRGHGSSSGAGGPIDYQILTADMVALLDALAIANAHIIGWSDGGIVALIIAAEHPRLVRSVVAIGANIASDGITTETREFISGWSVEAVSEEVAAAYRDNAAEPELWPVFFNTMRHLWLEAPILEPTQLADIKAPTMLVFGDRDDFHPDHIRLMFDGIADSQLFIVPGTSHFAPAEKPDLIMEVISTFLEAGTSEATLD